MIGWLSLPGTFLLYSFVSAGGCIILFFILPGKIFLSFYQMFKSKICFVLTETEGRTLQEIENHFSGKRKLPKSMKRKEPVSDIPFPTKFDINHWDSNEKFEQSLKSHGISGHHIDHHLFGHLDFSPHHQNHNHHGHDHQVHRHHHHDGHDIPLGISKLHSDAKTSVNNQRTIVNDDDFDTPL